MQPSAPRMGSTRSCPSSASGIPRREPEAARACSGHKNTQQKQQEHNKQQHFKRANEKTHTHTQHNTHNTTHTHTCTYVYKTHTHTHTHVHMYISIYIYIYIYATPPPMYPRFVLENQKISGKPAFFGRSVKDFGNRIYL